jgi:hypothetical protein
MANKRISCHHLLVDTAIKGNLWGLLERGVQESMDKEVFNETLEVAVGYAGSVGTSLWSKIKEDRHKVCPGYGVAMLSWLTLVWFDSMESRMEESISNHSMAISRIEDCEDNMNVCKNDVDTLKLEQVSMGCDIRMLEGAMGGMQEDLENLAGRVDTWSSNSRKISSLCETNARSLGSEIQRVQWETQGQFESFFGKFEKLSDVVDKKIVCQDEEIDRVVELVGQKIDTKMGEFSSDLMEALEIEENQRKDLEAKVAFLEEKLVNSLTHTANLTALILSIQARVVEVEDAVMEESEGDDGGEVASSSSSNLYPVENMVAIPVLAPSAIHMLVEIPEEFVPPILRPPLSVPLTPSPEYVQALEDDPAHDGTPEYWADPEASVDH